MKLTVSEIELMMVLDGFIPIPNHWEIAANQLSMTANMANEKNNTTALTFYPCDKDLFDPSEAEQLQIKEKLKQLKEKQKKQLDKKQKPNKKKKPKDK